MREGFDKEIDSLLRRTARASAGAHGNGAGASKPDPHLDADALAAFAEGALPEAARMNAVSHLADCGECRALAVNLARAAGVEAELEKRAAAAAASPSKALESKPSRGWLAALFAPRTLRYVAPALALCLVAAVSFVALRSRGDRGLVSLQESKNAGAPPSITTTENSSQQPSEATATSGASANANAALAAPNSVEAARDNKDAVNTTTTQPEKKAAEGDMPGGSAAPPADKSAGEGAAALAEPPPPPSKAKEEDAASGAPVEAPKAAPVTSAPAPRPVENTKAGPPPPAQNSDEVVSNEPSKQQQRAAQQRYGDYQSPDGAARNQSRSAANNTASGGALAGSARDDKDLRSARRESPPAAKRGRSDQEADSDAARTNAVEESRSVAGHRFRRDGGAWVDVNYKSSMASTGVRRGTDAYRALVADIPELGRVAEQLGGEVIVVVHGRAYRIR